MHHVQTLHCALSRDDEHNLMSGRMVPDVLPAPASDRCSRPTRNQAKSMHHGLGPQCYKLDTTHKVYTSCGLVFAGIKLIPVNYFHSGLAELLLVVDHPSFRWPSVLRRQYGEERKKENAQEKKERRRKGTGEKKKKREEQETSRTE